MTKPYIYKLFTGKVKELGTKGAKDPMERPWKTGMFKSVVDEPVWLTKTGLQNDEVADKKNHGGPEKALFAYPKKHYSYWQEELKNDEINIGAMGENLSVIDMDESNVCIGDTYKIGDTYVQVSQPRRPCWKPARRHKVIDFALRIQNSGLTGWYFRVLEEGFIKVDEYLELVDRPYPEWTISQCNDVMYVDKENMERAAKLASCELLATNWRVSLEKRLKGQESSSEKRVFGPNKEA
ncbi:MOSC domain-containing protein [Bacillaceae bacterium W0354]